MIDVRPGGEMHFETVNGVEGRSRGHVVRSAARERDSLKVTGFTRGFVQCTWTMWSQAATVCQNMNVYSSDSALLLDRLSGPALTTSSIQH
jgi:hypothetical protein